MPAATFYDVGDSWTEATPTFTQVTTALRIMGGDADVDNFLQATYADPNDIEAEISDPMSDDLSGRYAASSDQNTKRSAGSHLGCTAQSPQRLLRSRRLRHLSRQAHEGERRLTGSDGGVASLRFKATDSSDDHARNATVVGSRPGCLHALLERWWHWPRCRASSRPVD